MVSLKDNINLIGEDSHESVLSCELTRDLDQK